MPSRSKSASRGDFNSARRVFDTIDVPRATCFESGILSFVPNPALFMKIFRLVCVSFLLMAASDFAFAQTKPAPQKPAPSSAKPAANAPASPASPGDASPAPTNNVPPISTAVFGDWAVRCQRSADNTHQNCEVSLTIQEKDAPAPVAKIALGKPTPAGGLSLLVLLPNNVSFPSSVQIKTDDKDIWGMDVPWQRCIPGACFAETILKDSDLIRWRSLDSMGKITFKDALSNEVGISFSFHGLAQALDEFAKQSQGQTQVQ